MRVTVKSSRAKPRGGRVLSKVEAFQAKNSEITLDELFKIADIIKDMSEVRKNLAKEHYLLSEHSDKKF